MDTTPHDHDARPPLRPAPRWEDQSTLLADLAVSDIESGSHVRPTMIAFSGCQPLFLATLRPFEQGEHHDPVIEVGSLAAMLGADRVMVSLSGRAWSIDDPIPPVLPGIGDLRQRVIVLHQVDATAADPIVLSTVMPYDVHDDGSVEVGPALTDPGGQGFVALALMAVVGPTAPDRRPHPGVPDEELGQHVLRCQRLGHQIAWSGDLADRVQRLRMLPLDRA